MRQGQARLAETQPGSTKPPVQISLPPPRRAQVMYSGSAAQR